MQYAEALNEVESVVGREFVDRKAASYFRSGRVPDDLAVIKPESADEIQDTIAIALERQVPVFTVRGRYVNHRLEKRGGFLLDLSRMKNIVAIDRRNMKARIEAGVTFEQLKGALGKQGLKLLYPVSAVSESVLRSYLDRDVCLGASGLRSSNLSVFKAVLGSGEIWASGSLQLGHEGRPDFGEDQGPQLSNAFRASEDIFGIPYEATVYVYPRYEAREVLLFGFESIEDSLEFCRHTARVEHCYQVASADSNYWGALLGEDPEDCLSIGELFAPWTVALSLEHDRSLVELFREMVTEDALNRGAELLSGRAHELAEEALARPWFRWNHDAFKGDCHVVSYLCYPRSAVDYYRVAAEEFEGSDFEMGRVAVPVQYGGSFFCETVIYCPKDQFQQARGPSLRAYGKLCDMGALVDQPRGSIAEVVFERADKSYVEMIKTLKGIWDPGGILNPQALIREV